MNPLKCNMLIYTLYFGGWGARKLGHFSAESTLFRVITGLQKFLLKDMSTYQQRKPKNCYRCTAVYRRTGARHVGSLYSGMWIFGEYSAAVDHFNESLLASYTETIHLSSKLLLLYRAIITLYWSCDLVLWSCSLSYESPDSHKLNLGNTLPEGTQIR